MTVSKTTPVTLLAIVAFSGCHTGLGEDTEWGTQGAASTSTAGTSTTTDTGTTSTTSGTVTSASSTTTSSTSDATTTEATTASTTDPGADCGDGVVQPDVEACDDGKDNGKYGFCKMDCSGPGPHCGDMEVQIPEECDDDNTDNTDGCLDTCLNASCGDGFVQAGVEECDTTDNMNFPPGCLETCTWDKRLVFVTSTKFTPVTDFNSISGADEKCQAAATNAKFTGIFRAWLSGGGDSPATKWTELKDFQGRFVLPDGTIVATGWNNGALSLAHPINSDESKSLVENAPVWTGTTSAGQSGPANCDTWKTSNSSGQTGNTSQSDDKWTANNNAFECTNSARFYCFQVKL